METGKVRPCAATVQGLACLFFRWQLRQTGAVCGLALVDHFQPRNGENGPRMSDDEAREYLETLELLLASRGLTPSREQFIRFKNWIGGRQVEGEAGGECNRGNKRMMEYQSQTSYYHHEISDWINSRSDEGYRLISLKQARGQYLAVMEREREQGT